MSNYTAQKEWEKVVTEKMPHLSKPQAVVLALWSFGMVISQSCGLTTVVTLIASLLNQKENTVRQRMREWYMGAEDKKGEDRRDLDVTTCFVPLIKWVLSWWSSEEKRLAIAMDASTLGQRFVVLSISIVYRGCAIPVAWVLVQATEKGAWRPHWEALFGYLKESVPDDWFVIVMADRGLYAPWLYQGIKELGWHPFLRINRGGTFKLKEWQRLQT